MADALSGGHRPPWLDAERCSLLPLCLRYADQVESMADDGSDMDTMVAMGTQQKQSTSTWRPRTVARMQFTAEAWHGDPKRASETLEGHTGKKASRADQEREP